MNNILKGMYNDECRKEYGRYFDDIDDIIDDSYCSDERKKEYIHLGYAA